MILIGASGHAKVILDILLRNGITVDKILDAHPAVADIFGIPVEKEGLNLIFDFEAVAVIGIGSNSIRKGIAESRPFTYAQAIHPSSCISEFSSLGEGTVVMAHAAINPGAVIGRHCIINTGAIIEHDCVLEDYVHISPNAALAGNVTVGEGSHIGIGAAVIQGITIGKWVTVGAGAVIIRDIPDFATVVGNPGRIIRKEADQQ